MKSLSIIIPVYNAEKTIAELCEKLIAILEKNYKLQIVLVNDYSRDNTDSICKALQQKHFKIIVYARLAKNFGEHNAVMAGLNLSSGDYAVIMDDDFQNPPEEVPALVEELMKGYDVVYCSYEVKKDSIFRNIGSYLNGSMARVVLDKPKNLYLSSFKGLNRFLVDEIVIHKNPKPYIDAMILEITKNIGVVSVKHHERKAGSSGYTIKKLISLWGDMIVSYSLLPIRFLAVAGIIMTLIGSYSILAIFLYNIHPALEDPSDIEELTAYTMFFRGFQLFATAIVGEYVGRIYLKLNKKPQFIFREVISEQQIESIRKKGTDV